MLTCVHFISNCQARLECEHHEQTPHEFVLNVWSDISEVWDNWLYEGPWIWLLWAHPAYLLSTISLVQFMSSSNISHTPSAHAYIDPISHAVMPHQTSWQTSYCSWELSCPTCALIIPLVYFTFTYFWTFSWIPAILHSCQAIQLLWTHPCQSCCSEFGWSSHPHWPWAWSRSGQHHCPASSLWFVIRHGWCFTPQICCWYVSRWHQSWEHLI